MTAVSHPPGLSLRQNGHCWGVSYPRAAGARSRQVQSRARPDIDENGVDRAQIREMLRLTPEERLRRVEAFVEAALEIRELNEPRPVR